VFCRRGFVLQSAFYNLSEVLNRACEAGKATRFFYNIMEFLLCQPAIVRRDQVPAGRLCFDRHKHADRLADHVGRDCHRANSDQIGRLDQL